MFWSFLSVISIVQYCFSITCNPPCNETWAPFQICDGVSMKCRDHWRTCLYWYKCPPGSNCDDGFCKCLDNYQEGRCDNGKCPDGYLCNSCDVCLDKDERIPSSASSLMPTNMIILATVVVFQVKFILRRRAVISIYDL
ncbi:hypothetical protein DdX_20025 [Ditylenchus destructor]|uniref:Uncharacterized protein n=1 Tax=Ditylenchus destructor TaxID=166010 RepID=A0AAD4MHW6_9BILA|nr:hypothetical protein DdX_20025 [Ditylenchus destructor]